jgi:hypothetical protein
MGLGKGQSMTTGQPALRQILVDLLGCVVVK